MYKTTTIFFVIRPLVMALILFVPASLLAQKLNRRHLKRLLKKSEIMADHFTGFALYDQEKQKMVYELNADQYFTPASNTKLFTFYTSLNMLGDSIPGLRYVIKGDSLIFWGTGDPSFLHSYLKSDRVFGFLRNAPFKLFYSPENYEGNFYGAGWPWSDYNDDYQAEITPLPVEDNVALVFADNKGALQIRPAIFSHCLKPDTSFHPSVFSVKRSLSENEFIYPSLPVPAGFQQTIPLKITPGLTAALLADTLKREVGITNVPLPSSAQRVFSIPADSAYKRMLLVSDNFIAEQLLLTCSDLSFGTLNADSVIEYSKRNFLKNLPDAPIWVDGSGLSRYNLFTPRSIVCLLVKISEKIGNEQRLYNFFPAGGQSGTLRRAYSTDNGKPFVWAKTGSLSNNYNQSGYLITRKGRRLTFSFMNNNFVRPTSEIRTEVGRIMTEIHNRF